MANSRIMLVCKHCGEGFCIGKGYFGSYVTLNEVMFEQLNDFFKKHEYGCCSNDMDCSDNARNHFAILEEGEDLDVLTADVVPRAEVEYWKEQCFHACMNNGCLDKAIVKAAVAREIFEEIEKYMMDSVDVTHTAYKTIGASTFAILKKKYTEVQK